MTDQPDPKSPGSLPFSGAAMPGIFANRFHAWKDGGMTRFTFGEVGLDGTIQPRFAVVCPTPMLEGMMAVLAELLGAIVTFPANGQEPGVRH